MRRLAPVALALLSFFMSGCGYALAGKGNALPAHIRVIAIPDFQNQSATPDVDRIISEAVRAEFQSRGRFKIVHETAGADAVLSGTVHPLAIVPTALTDTRQASKYLVTVQAAVEFKDQTDNKVLYNNQNVRVSEEYQVTEGLVLQDASSLFSTDATALTRIAKAFARSLVQAILEAF